LLKLSPALYVLVALLWLVPDRRIEKAIMDMPESAKEGAGKEGAASSAPLK